MGLGVITAHLGGAPLEELVVPMLTSGGALVVVVRAALGSLRRPRRQAAVHRTVRP